MPSLAQFDALARKLEPDRWKGHVHPAAMLGECTAAVHPATIQSVDQTVPAPLKFHEATTASTR